MPDVAVDSISLRARFDALTLTTTRQPFLLYYDLDTATKLYKLSLL